MFSYVLKVAEILKKEKPNVMPHRDLLMPPYCIRRQLCLVINVFIKVFVPKIDDTQYKRNVQTRQCH